jgi:hypothetical protein
MAPISELAYRMSGGVEVVLWWHRALNEVSVSVSDEQSGAYFEIGVDPAKALDAFEHPYAYAAYIGLPYEDALLANWAAASVATAGSPQS